MRISLIVYHCQDLQLYLQDLMGAESVTLNMVSRALCRNVQNQLLLPIQRISLLGILFPNGFNIILRGFARPILLRRPSNRHQQQQHMFRKIIKLILNHKLLLAFFRRCQLFAYLIRFLPNIMCFHRESLYL
jgi:hypothetical protein